MKSRLPALIFVFVASFAHVSSVQAQTLDVIAYRKFADVADNAELKSLLTDYSKSLLPRTWKAKAGTELKAKFQGFADANQFVLLSTTSKEVKKVPVAALSDTDLTFLQNIAELEKKIRDIAFNASQSTITSVQDAASKSDQALKDAKKEIELLGQKLTEAEAKIARLTPSNAMAVAGNIPIVDAQRLEALGPEYKNKKVRFLAVEFNEISNTWVSDMPGVAISSNGLISTFNKTEADKWIGFTFDDSKGKYFSHAFAEKEKWAEFFLQLPKGSKLNLEGYVFEMGTNNWHGFVLTNAEIVKQ